MIIRNWQRALRGVPSIFFFYCSLYSWKVLFLGSQIIFRSRAARRSFRHWCSCIYVYVETTYGISSFFFFFKIHKMSCFEAIHALKSFRFDCFFSVFFSICYSFKKRGCFDPFFERKKIEQKCGEDKQNKRQNQKMKTTKTLKIEQPHETCKCFAYHNVVVAAAVFDTVVVTASLVCCKFVRS